MIQPILTPAQFLLLGIIFPFAIGACIGSFINVCFYRIPRGKSVVTPPSACPQCNQPIPLYRNIPIVTWLLQRGQSACCRKPIPKIYFLMEVGYGLAGIVIALPFFAWFKLLPF